MRLGALARHITDELPLLQARTVRVAGHLLEIRGTCVLVDGAVKALSPAGGILAGWLTAAGGTELGFAVAGIAGIATSLYVWLRSRSAALVEESPREEVELAA